MFKLMKLGAVAAQSSAGTVPCAMVRLSAKTAAGSSRS